MIYNEEVWKKIETGIDKVANAVKITVGSRDLLFLGKIRSKNRRYRYFNFSSSWSKRYKYGHRIL